MKIITLLIVLLCVAVNSIVGCNANITDEEKISEKAVYDAGNLSDEYIIEKFDEAYELWVSWVYGQLYRTYDFSSDVDGPPYREYVNKESPIQSTSQLRNEMEKYFTIEMTDMYFQQLNPEDKDGKLYINTGDVGGPYSGPESITVEKISDECYRLNLDIWSYMDEEEPDMPDKCVYYVFKDGKWVFENDPDDEFFYSRVKH